MLLQLPGERLQWCDDYRYANVLHQRQPQHERRLARACRCHYQQVILSLRRNVDGLADCPVKWAVHVAVKGMLHLADRQGLGEGWNQRNYSMEGEDGGELV